MLRKVTDFRLRILSAIFLASIFVASQKIETVNGGCIVHNVKRGKLGSKLGVSIQLIRKIGDIDAADKNLAFNYPFDIAMDTSGTIYVLDSSNNRIQKIGMDGKYLATFGRRGQGPGEFFNPDSMDINTNGVFYILDSSQNRIQTMTPEGRGNQTIRFMDRALYKLRCLKSGLLAVKSALFYNSFDNKSKLPKLIKLLDQEGKAQKSFVDGVDFGDGVTSFMGNDFDYAVDKNDNFCVSYSYQNRIEKYLPDGKLLWKADRPLNYATGVLKRGKIEMNSAGGGTVIQPEMNACSAGIAIDDKGRAWVVTLNRQLRKEEKIMTTTSRGGGGGISTLSLKTKGNVDLRTTDAYKLEIFDPDGVLLGDILLTQFVNSIRIIGDSLFLIDRERGVTVYQYRIVEK